MHTNNTEKLYVTCIPVLLLHACTVGEPYKYGVPPFSILDWVAWEAAQLRDLTATCGDHLSWCSYTHSSLATMSGSPIRESDSLCCSQKILIRRGNLVGCRWDLCPEHYCRNLACSQHVEHGPHSPRRGVGMPLLVWTATWLILPVVICLSQRLSHACLSTSLTKVKPRMAH